MNAHFNAHEITNNAQLKAHYLPLTVRNILILFLLMMLFTPKHLKLIAGGSLLGDFVNNPDEGYRTLVPNKITQTQPITKNPQGQGGASKGER
jgi:hypothetical protein